MQPRQHLEKVPILLLVAKVHSRIREFKSILIKTIQIPNIILRYHVFSKMLFMFVFMFFVHRFMLPGLSQAN